MRRPLFLLLALLAFCSSAQASLPGLSEVLGARRLLNPSTWSQVLRIDRMSANNLYPQSFYGLVFEVASVLWLYTPQEGTQSLSHFVGRSEEDKANLDGLVRDAMPALKTLKAQSEDSLPESKSRDVPPNACFLQSLSLLDERLRKGYSTEYASLFTFYYRSDGRTRGHTVLVYSRGGSTFAVDPADGEALCYRVEASVKHEQLARQLSHGLEVTATRELPLGSYLRHARQLALAAKGPSAESALMEGEKLAALSWHEPPHLTQGSLLGHPLPTLEPHSPSTTAPNRVRELAEPL